MQYSKYEDEGSRKQMNPLVDNIPSAGNLGAVYASSVAFSDILTAVDSG